MKVLPLRVADLFHPQDVSRKGIMVKLAWSCKERKIQCTFYSVCEVIKDAWSLYILKT